MAMDQVTRLHIRELSADDFSRGYLALVDGAFSRGSQDATQDVTPEEFSSWLQAVRQQDGHIFVLCDPETSRVVATAKALIECKMHNRLAVMGHVEDVVVDPKYRGRGLGRRMVQHAFEYCVQRGCYKTVLVCREDLQGFYEGCGAERRGLLMCLRPTPSEGDLSHR